VLLAKEFDLTSAQIMEMINRRARLGVAVRGGVAEQHLQRLLERSRLIQIVAFLDRDGEPDFEITLASGRKLLVECKNASPHRYSNGDAKVEVQKTRASRGDPLSRYYRYEQFDILAACMWAVTKRWEFRFLPSPLLEPLSGAPTRIRPMQPIAEPPWTNDFDAVIGRVDEER